MLTVKATREGLIGGKTASGYLVDMRVPFVALPARAALRTWVRLFNPVNGKGTRALVLDVGPWNEDDNAYVFQTLTLNRLGVPVLFAQRTLEAGIREEITKGVRPMAESGLDTRGRKTNGAGIDLGELVWVALGMKDNSCICWEFE